MTMITTMTNYKIETQSGHMEVDGDEYRFSGGPEGKLGDLYVYREEQADPVAMVSRVFFIAIYEPEHGLFFRDD